MTKLLWIISLAFSAVFTAPSIVAQDLVETFALTLTPAGDPIALQGGEQIEFVATINTYVGGSSPKGLADPAKTAANALLTGGSFGDFTWRKASPIAHGEKGDLTIDTGTGVISESYTYTAEDGDNTDTLQVSASPTLPTERRSRFRL
jgi:hypothetical protein